MLLKIVNDIYHTFNGRKKQHQCPRMRNSLRMFREKRVGIEREDGTKRDLYMRI